MPAAPRPGAGVLPEATACPALQVDKYVEGAEETRLQERARRVRISCQDPYANPAWSPWSDWQDVDAAPQRRLRAR